MKIIRVAPTEFELDDGTLNPISPALPNDLRIRVWFVGFRNFSGLFAYIGVGLNEADAKRDFQDWRTQEIGDKDYDYEMILAYRDIAISSKRSLGFQRDRFNKIMFSRDYLLEQMRIFVRRLYKDDCSSLDSEKRNEFAARYRDMTPTRSPYQRCCSSDLARTKNHISYSIIIPFQFDQVGLIRE